MIGACTITETVLVINHNNNSPLYNKLLKECFLVTKVLSNYKTHQEILAQL